MPNRDDGSREGLLLRVGHLALILQGFDLHLDLWQLQNTLWEAVRKGTHDRALLMRLAGPLWFDEAALLARLALLAADTAQTIALLERSVARSGEPYATFFPLVSLGPERLLLATLFALRGRAPESIRWLDSFSNTLSYGDVLYGPRVACLRKWVIHLVLSMAPSRDGHRHDSTAISRTQQLRSHG